MGATQSTSGGNNHHAVAALMAYNLAQAQAQQQQQQQQRHSVSTSATTSSTPPSGCLMHIAREASSSSASTSSTPYLPPAPKTKKPALPPLSAGQCPIPHDQRDAYLFERQASSSSAASATARGSMAPSPPPPTSQGDKASWSSTLNPLNMMPTFSQGTAPEQQTVLSTERTMSSIPRSRSSAAPGASPYDAPALASACLVPHESRSAGATDGVSSTTTAASSSSDDGSKWEYPSPQQFYNALLRKGWETPEEHVETMVLIHNFLNEQAWLEVLEWEKLAGADSSRAELARFQGKPGTLSPKARLFGMLATLMPSRFSEEPPFDRHDWIVRRRDQDGREVRYIIDYYSVPDDPEKDEPEFVLDVRPALDSLESVKVRARKTFQEWSQAGDEATKA